MACEDLEIAMDKAEAAMEAAMEGMTGDGFDLAKGVVAIIVGIGKKSPATVTIGALETTEASINLYNHGSDFLDRKSDFGDAEDAYCRCLLHY